MSGLMSPTGSPPPPSLLCSPHHTSLHLTWTPPTDDGGSPIHSFTLQVRDAQYIYNCDNHDISSCDNHINSFFNTVTIAIL